MKYLLTQFSLLLAAVILLYYLSTLPHFTPLTPAGDPDWYKVSTVLAVIFIGLQALIATVIFLFQKFIAFGWKEFPDKGSSLKWGLGLAFGIMIVILLNIFHLFSFWWGVGILLIISLIIIFI